MKTLRFIGMALVAIIMSVNFVACGDDDDDKSGDAANFIGKWKIEKTNYEGETEEWDGYPYLVLTSILQMKQEQLNLTIRLIPMTQRIRLLMPSM